METSQSSYLRGRPEDLFGLPDPLVLGPVTAARLAPGSTSSNLMPSAPTWQQTSSKADFKRKSCQNIIPAHHLVRAGVSVPSVVGGHHILNLLTLLE